jgi:hypothetical protein
MVLIESILMEEYNDKMHTTDIIKNRKEIMYTVQVSFLTLLLKFE